MIRADKAKPLNTLYRQEKQDSPTVDYRTKMEGGGLLIKAFSVQVFRFSKQLLARDVSLLFNRCKLGGLAVIQHNSAVMLHRFHWEQRLRNS